MPDDAVHADVTRDVTSGDDPRILDAVKEYLTLLETGPVSRDEFLARHADIAAQLADYLDGLELIHGAAVGVRQATARLSQSTAHPKALGDFRILRELGRGGMGVVYEALHVPLARRVALKVLPLVNSFDSLRLQRFKIEAQAAARLQHPNIVQVYSVGDDSGAHYYAMQLIEGFPLSAAIERLRQLHGISQPAEAPGFEPTLSLESAPEDAGPRPETTRNDAHQSTDRVVPMRDDSIVDSPPEIVDCLNKSLLINSYVQPKSYFRHVAELTRQAALALEHAHQCGIVHRDIKPANLLVDAQGHVWVTDFGLARISTDVQLTRTGTPLGTLRYMSPEQAIGNAGLIDQRADVYSLGVTLYELLTLEPAIPGDESHTLLRRVIEDEPRPPRALNKNIPPELETIVLKAAAKSRDDRYVSAQQFADDLQRWLADEPILARPPSLWERATKWRRRHRVLVRAAALFTAFAVCGLVVAMFYITKAYRAEAQEHQAAAASFAQARRAVDAFTQIGESELAAKPELRDVRRRLLETALGYYREFEKEHGGDPVAMAIMAPTSQRIGRIVDELKSLEGSAPLLLMSDARVQTDLQLSEPQREKVNAVLATFRRDRSESEADPQKSSLGAEERLAALLRAHESALTSLLTPQQTERLQQIARQQRAPFVFRSAEIITALELTPDQRGQVNTIIEEERIDGGGRQSLGRSSASPENRPPDNRPPSNGPPDGFGEGRRPPDGPPREFADLEAQIADALGPGPPPGERRPGPPRDVAPGPPGDRPNEIPRNLGGGPTGMSDAKRRALTRILAVLTSEQRAAWTQLTGRPFPYDLNWGPDDLIPR